MATIEIIFHYCVHTLLQLSDTYFLLLQSSLGALVTWEGLECRWRGLLVHALDVLASQHGCHGLGEQALLSLHAAVAHSRTAATLLFVRLRSDHGLSGQRHLLTVRLRERNSVLVVFVRSHRLDVFVRSRQVVLLVLLGGVNLVAVKDSLVTALLERLARYVQLVLELVDASQPRRLGVRTRTLLRSKTVSHR